MPLIVWSDLYTVEDANKHASTVFIFGDNVTRKGLRGQAVIRGLPNTFGIPTKYKPLSDPSAFYHDSDVNAWDNVNFHLARLRIFLESNIMLAWPKAGIGTGYARWQQNSPKLLNHVNSTIHTLLEQYGPLNEFI